MVKQPECPECGKVLKDGRGLNGHLRMAHQITGEEHDRMMRKALAEAEEREGEGDEPGRLEEDRLTQLVELAALSHGMSPLDFLERRVTVEGEFLENGISLDVEDSLWSKTDQQKVADQVIEDLKQRFRGRREETNAALKTELEQEIEQRLSNE